MNVQRNSSLNFDTISQTKADQDWGAQSVASNTSRSTTISHMMRREDPKNIKCKINQIIDGNNRYEKVRIMKINDHIEN